VRKTFHEDYMDKIIQLAIYLPQLDQPKIKDFVASLSSDEDITKCASIFGVGLPPNPRKIKQVLRTFLFVRDIMIDDIREGRIKSSILAKIVVIQNQIPDLFKEFIERPSLLQELEKLYHVKDAQVDINEEDERLIEKAEAYSNNYPQLRRILLIQTDEADTFINTDLSPYIALIGVLAVVSPLPEERKPDSFLEADVPNSTSLFEWLPIKARSASRSRKVLRGYKILQAEYVYQIHAEDQDHHTQYTALLIEAINDGVNIFEGKYAWTGRGKETDPEILTPGCLLMGSPIKRNIWNYYYVYLGHELGKGERMEIRIKQDLLDLDHEFETYMAKTITEPLDKLFLQALIPVKSILSNAFSYELDSSGLNGQIIYKVASTPKIVTLDGSSYSEISYEIQKPRLGHRYEIRWELL